MKNLKLKLCIAISFMIMLSACGKAPTHKSFDQKQLNELEKLGDTPIADLKGEQKKSAEKILKEHISSINGEAIQQKWIDNGRKIFDKLKASGKIPEDARFDMKIKPEYTETIDAMIKSINESGDIIGDLIAKLDKFGAAFKADAQTNKLVQNGKPALNPDTMAILDAVIQMLKTLNAKDFAVMFDMILGLIATDFLDDINDFSPATIHNSLKDYINKFEKKISNPALKSLLVKINSKIDELKLPAILD